VPTGRGPYDDDGSSAPTVPSSPTQNTVMRLMMSEEFTRASERGKPGASSAARPHTQPRRNS